MATKLDKTIKRELDLDGKLYTVAISPEGVKITPKGARKGQEISWSSLVSGEADLRRDLNMSVDAYRVEFGFRLRPPLRPVVRRVHGRAQLRRTRRDAQLHLEGHRGPSGARESAGRGTGGLQERARRHASETLGFARSGRRRRLPEFSGALPDPPSHGNVPGSGQRSSVRLGEWALRRAQQLTRSCSGAGAEHRAGTA